MTRFKPRSQYDLSLIALPCNPELSTEPNKSQTIVNVVRAEGPMSKDQLIARMQELLGPKRAAKGNILSLVQGLLYGKPPRIDWDDDRCVLFSTAAAVEAAS